MKKTQMIAEQAAAQASKEILKQIENLQKTVLKFDQIHKAEAKRILRSRISITQIIRKHLFDCYINSWITEAEELEDLFGDELFTKFIFRMQYMKEHGADMMLEREAYNYINEIPTPDRRLHALRLIDGVIPPRRPTDPVDFFVYKYFQKYIRQISDIRQSELSTHEKLELTKWRTGIHGESGLGYRLTSLLRTESDKAQAEASFDAYEEAGLDGYKYNAMLDDKTCDTCKALDGRIFLLSEKEPGVNFPIIHNNCRCYIEPVKIRGTHGTNRHD